MKQTVWAIVQKKDGRNRYGDSSVAGEILYLDTFRRLLVMKVNKKYEKIIKLMEWETKK